MKNFVVLDLAITSSSEKFRGFGFGNNQFVLSRNYYRLHSELIRKSRRRVVGPPRPPHFYHIAMIFTKNCSTNLNFLDCR